MPTATPVSTATPASIDTPQAWLLGLWEERRRRSPGLSLRAFARFVKVSPATMSQVIAGKRPFTIKMAQRVFAVADVDGAEQERVLKMLLGNGRAGAVDGRTMKLLDADAFQVISEWYHYAILSLGELKEARYDAVWIGKRLGIRPALAAQAMQRLERLGLVERRGRGYRQTGEPLTFASPVASTAVQKFHRGILERAARSLENDSVDERDFGAITMAIDPRRLAEARQRMKKFRRELCAFLEGGTSKRVYTLAMQLFPLDGGLEGENGEK